MRLKLYQICTVFELQLVNKVCYNVKCKEYMQAAADGCQSLLCFKDRLCRSFFMLENKRMSYFVGRFFKKFQERGLENRRFFW